MNYEKLSHDQRMIIVNKFFIENLNYEQIGELVNCPAKNVRMFINELMNNRELKKQYFPKLVEDFKKKDKNN